MTNEKHFLKEIGFALSMINEKDADYKLCGLDLVIKEAEAQKQIILEQAEKKNEKA